VYAGRSSCGGFRGAQYGAYRRILLLLRRGIDKRGICVVSAREKSWAASAIRVGSKTFVVPVLPPNREDA